MRCPSCDLDRRPLASFPVLRNLYYPHLCRQMPKLGPAFTADRISPWGIGSDWMPPVYGEYYARSPAVYAAVKLRADALLVPPLRVFRRDTNGDLQDVPAKHPLVTLLDKVNPFWTKADLLQATSIYLDLWGSCFWMLKKDSPSSIPTEIWTLRPDVMQVVPSQENYIAGYAYQSKTGSRIPLRTDEVVWLKRFNPLDEYAGLSPLAAARLSVDMGNEAIRHNRNVFRNGMLWGNVALAAKDNATLTEDQVTQLRDQLKQRYAGTANSNVPLILQNLDPKNLGMTNRDLEFMASLRWSLEDVARVYGVPKPMLGDLERATYANIDAAERIFWRSSMMPHLMFIEGELNEMLVPQFRDERLVVKFDVSEIHALQEDANAVAITQQADVASGILTINEVREQRGLPPVPWGDVAWLPLGMQPIEEPSDAAGILGPPMIPGRALPANGNRKSPLMTRKLFLPVDGYRKWEPPSLSDSFVGKVLELHSRGLSYHETQFVRIQRALFADQHREVMTRIRTELPQFGGSSIRMDEVIARAFPLLELFNLGEWAERFRKAAAGFYGTALLFGAYQQISAFSLDVVLNTALVQPWLDDRIAFWAQRVNEETAKELIDEITAGIEAKESIQQIQDRVETVFDFADAVRSERIARTETQAVMNHGAVEAYKQSGVVESKMWLATLDARTRDAHLEAHRQTVPLEANFIVMGEAIAHPGDGSPANSIQCRCSVAPIISRRMLHMTRAEPDQSLEHQGAN